MKKQLIKMFLLVMLLLYATKCSGFYYPENKTLTNDFFQQPDEIVYKVLYDYDDVNGNTDHPIEDERNGIVYERWEDLVRIFINLFSVHHQAI